MRTTLLSYARLVHISIGCVQLLSVAALNSLCLLQCQERSEGPVSKYCRQRGGRNETNCCLTNDEQRSLIALDLRRCAHSAVSGLWFKDFTFAEWKQSVEMIDISNNEEDERWLAVPEGAWRNMPNLNRLILNHEQLCPGGEKAWHTRMGNVCAEQEDFCALTNFTCPQWSHCLKNGPGFIRCACDEGHFGYKCTKTGIFKVHLFLLLTFGVTLIGCSLVWLVTRRRRSLHQKPL